MAVWLIPALKAVLPHVATIVSAATPAFTKKKADATANQTLLLQQQITELQAAASENAAHIKELAAQLQSTVEALEQTASIAAAQVHRVMVLSLIATALSVSAFGVALFLILTR